jgi:sugar/nucleoside kinase (ribokinase family)
MNTPELRERAATQLQAAAHRVSRLNAFIGLDGFVDDILHVVDKRESAEKYLRLPHMAQWGERIRAAAGKSTNIELVSQRTKLGGNGPIMANALASFGFKVSYLGNLGYPNLHPVFAEFARRADVHSIAEPGYTDAVEFEDGKVMLGKHQSLKEVNWANVRARFGQDKFAAKILGADFIAFVNWTMLTYMNDIWSATLREICPQLNGPRRTMFFDLADPEKRTPADITAALALIAAFEKHFDVILGLNESESSQIGRALGLNTSDHSPEGLAKLGREILQRVPVGTLVIHPTHYAMAISADGPAIVEGPFTPKPLITTGAGDHFNAGFCLGKLLGLDNATSVLTGVTTSGFYVRSATSPTVADLATTMRHWPDTRGG